MAAAVTGDTAARVLALHTLPVNPRLVSIWRGRTVKVKRCFFVVLKTNIFQDRNKTSIMQFPYLQSAFVLLAIMAVLAGCSAPSAPAPATSNQSVLMSQLLLSRSDVPFVVADEKTQNPDLTKPEFMLSGAIKGMTRFWMNEKTTSATSVQMGQTLVEYPSGKGSLAFARFERMTREGDQSRFRVTWLPDPKIGNQSCSLIIADLTGVEKPIGMIVFEKSDIMESIIMVGPSIDTDGLTRAARAAAAKIP
jgi:hypothetical protein